MSQLTYTLKNIELVYKTIHSVTLANQAESVYNLGKEFAYDYVLRPEIRTLNKGTDKNFMIKVDTQNRSLKAVLLLFEEPYTEGTRFREIHLSRHHESQSHDQRPTQHGVQQRYRSNRHVGRGPPLLCEREKQNRAHEPDKVLNG